jgi:hypothetical protein
MRGMTIGRMMVLAAAVLAGACKDVERDPAEGQPPSATKAGGSGAGADSAQSDNTGPNGAHTGG